VNQTEATGRMQDVSGLKKREKYLFLLLQILVILKVKCVVLQFDISRFRNDFVKKDGQIFGYLKFDSIFTFNTITKHESVIIMGRKP
jgi:hypothetical protein